MADVSLDDLIRKDKEKGKQNHAQNKKQPFNKKKPFHPKNNDGPKKGDFRNNEPKQNNPNFKHKPINKKFQGKFKRPEAPIPQRPERVERKNPIQKNQPKPQRKEHTEPRDNSLIRTLKVLGLSPEFTNEELYKLFAAEGSMEKCLIEVDNFGRTQTTAIVKYHQPQAAQAAIRNLNNHRIKNGVLTVQPYKNVKKQ